jgi:hypothetical protein
MAFAAKFAKKGLAMQIQVDEPAPAAVSFNISDSGAFCTYGASSDFRILFAKTLRQALAMAQSKSLLMAFQACRLVLHYPI